MNLKWLLLYFSVLLFFSSCSTGKVEAEEQGKPNLFLFIADDLSDFDLGITGNPFVRTPTIDQFARGAVSFTRMYTPSAMCAPSRSSLYTGLYPHRNGCHMNHGSVYDGVKSLPQYLAPLGYTVALVGKTHIKPKKAFPFDYVHPDSLDGYLKNVSSPVCIIYASNEPHGPHAMGVHDPDSVMIPQKWLNTEKTRQKLAGYYADISTLDQEFNNFRSTIQQYQLDQQALIAFTSDHGYEYFAKWSCYETGLRVPFYTQAKGLKFKRESIDHLTSFVDIVPTFVELAGGTPPEEIDGKSFLPLLQGNDQPIHDFIYGAHTTRGIYSGLAYPIRSITDGQWKYIRNLNHEEKFQNIITNGWSFDADSSDPAWKEWLAIRQASGDGAKWARLYQTRPYEELYDLENDPYELDNLASNTTHAEIKEKLSKQLDQWMGQQNDSGMEAEMSVPLKARDQSKIPKE